ncbi:MAG: ATP-dependent DNA helicase UvrD2 [Actinomycetota bacterium]
MDADQLVAGLNEAQLAAVTATGGPVVVMAGAGSGKTRVLTRRIAWRIATDDTDPTRVLALTFTRKAAGELRHRLRTLGLRDEVAAGTFHGIALVQLRRRWADRNTTPPAILDRRSRFLARAASLGRGVRASDVLAEIDWARARLITPEQYSMAAAEAGRTPPITADQLADVMVRFAQEKRRRRMVDFDDLLELAIRDLQSDPGYAEAVRWRYRHLCVDEFQDVNPLQYELLSHWRGDRPDLFVVGDTNQAIYGWNGAEPDLLATFARREPGATVITLADNYRSSPQVLELAATLSDGPGLVAHRPDGPRPSVTAYPDDKAEAVGVAERIREARRVAGSWSDQAVLVRTNAQLLLIEQTLNDLGVPARHRAGAGPLASPEVASLIGQLTSPGVDVADAAAELSAEATMEDAPTSGPEVERRANRAALLRLVNDYLAVDPAPSGPGLAAWLSTLDGNDVADNADAVELTTFHGAKGLEWPVVHVAGLEDGFVPIAYAETGGQKAEERRLFYVAVTRAEQELHLSWAAARTFTNRPVGREVSPLLAGPAAAISRLGVAPAHRVDWRAKIAASRQRLADAPPPSSARGRRRAAQPAFASAAADDPAAEQRAYQALRQWRQRRARASDVPVHVVLSDRTLRSLARARPTNRAALAAIDGIGPSKLSRYGDDLINLLNAPAEHA